MHYTLDINDRPFRAILEGTKKVEGRTNTKDDKTAYNEMEQGDTITFINNSTNEKLSVIVKFVHHYKDVNEMLSTEGGENVLSSSPKTVEHGVASYNSLNGYKEGIAKNGIYAIGLKTL